MFNTYKAGVISRKSEGYEDIYEEAQDAFLRMVNFAQEALPEPDWDRRELELENIRTLDYAACRRWYLRIFAPNEA